MAQTPDWWLSRHRQSHFMSDELGPPIAAPIALPEDDSLLPIMLRISNAVLCAEFFDEVLEVVAEQALLAVNASTVSISRWERDADQLVTLINVGALHPGEERWPDADKYALTGDADAVRLLSLGEPYLHCLDDEEVDPVAATYLRQIGRGCEVGVPVLVDNTIWGEIWAGGPSGHRFGRGDVQNLQAVAAYIAAAIGRGELFSTIWRHAHRDPLTDLPNRRELDRQFAEIDWETTTSAMIIGDLDGFKRVNDRDGHPAGDILLRHIATVLRDAVGDSEAAVPVRLGGDEFCVLLPHGTLTDAERLAHHISGSIRESLDTEVTMTWGAAESGPLIRSGPALLAAADAALLRARALGPGRFNAEVGNPLTRRSYVDRRQVWRAGAYPLVARVRALVDAARPLPAFEALEILALQAQNAVNGAGWAVSVTSRDRGGLVTSSDVDSAQNPDSGLWVLRSGTTGEEYRLADYPETLRAIETGSHFIAAVDLPESDPAEVALLTRLGYRAVLAVGVSDAQHGYLVEVYPADGYEPLLQIADTVRVLAHYCVSVAQVPAESNR